MYRRESIPSGIRLQQLIQNQHAEILDREKDNSRFIHLYNIGTYWVAFEQSACGLSSIFPKSEISLFMVPGRPEYVVMASVASEEVIAHLRKHVIRYDGADYKVLAIASLPVGYFQKWYSDAVKSVLCNISQL